MKNIILFSFLSLLAFHASSKQQTTIRGKFLNCHERVLYLSASTGIFREDSIKIEADGSFHYSTTAIQSPLRAVLTNRKHINIQLFLAPSYDLQLYADVQDFQTLNATLDYKGAGSQTNAYWKTLLTGLKPDTVRWTLKDEDTYIAWLKRVHDHRELIDQTFNESNHEPFRDHFKKSLLLDEKFGPILTAFSSYAFEHNYSWQQIQQMIARLDAGSLPEEFKDEANLASTSFCYLLSQYPFYCKMYNAFPADSSVRDEGLYTWLLADRFYNGKVFDYYASQKTARTLSDLYKLDDLNKLKPYLENINDHALRQQAMLSYATRIRNAMMLQPGAPSPVFNLPDTSGNLHRLEAMKGKVIYIDLWASWCGPCKQEMPWLRKIYEQYKDNDQLAIISIACFDARNRAQRLGIIKAEKMDWLQLEDTNDSFAKAYQVTFIPRFIIIDKQGNIVDSDAARPGTPRELIAILDSEINK